MTSPTPSREAVVRENFETDEQYRTARLVASAAARMLNMVRSTDRVRLSPTAALIHGGGPDDRVLILRRREGRGTEPRMSAMVVVRPDGSASASGLDVGELVIEQAPGQLTPATLARWLIDGPPALLEVAMALDTSA